MKPKIRLLILSLLFLLLALTEHCIGPFWWGCNPPYLLCFTVVCALFSGEKTAAIFGLLAGLVADSASAGVFGLRAVMFLVFAYLLAFFTEAFLSRNVFTCLLSGVVTVGLSELAVFGIENLSHPVPIQTAAYYIFLPRLVMSVPLLLLLYIVFSLLFRERDGYPVRR